MHVLISGPVVKNALTVRYFSLKPQASRRPKKGGGSFATFTVGQCTQDVFWQSVSGAEIAFWGEFARFWADSKQPGAQKSPKKGRNPLIGETKYTLA